MNNKELLEHYTNIADIHARRLHAAFQKISLLVPFTPEKCEQLSDEEVAFFDMMTTRMSKLQDTIGAKIFPLILTLLGEDAQSFIDKLHRLEKLRYLDDTDHWMQLREIRNQITHDYPNDYEILSKHANDFVQATQEILTLWTELRQKIMESFFS